MYVHASIMCEVHYIYTGASCAHRRIMYTQAYHVHTGAICVCARISIAYWYKVLKAALAGAL